MTFWDEKVVVARKAHTCDECCRTIMPGERYTNGAGINVFGEFGCWTTHSDCLAASRELMKLGDCPSDEWWSLHENVWEMDEAGVAALALDWPAVYERFRADLEAHDRAPDHFVWRGSPHYIPLPRKQFTWWKP